MSYKLPPFDADKMAAMSAKTYPAAPTADTITTARLVDALAALDLAREGLRRLVIEADSGGVSPAEAAADYREITANLKAAL